MRSLVLILFVALLGFSSCSEKKTPLFEYKTNEYIKDWLVAGPFPNCEGCSETNYMHGKNCTGFYTDYLAPEGGEMNVVPEEGENVTVKDKDIERTWFRLQGKEDKIHLSKYLKPKDMVVAYAFSRVRSPKKQKVILSVGSNDGVKVFLNGKQVHEMHPRTGRWLQADNDYVPVTLKKGINNLMLKIDQGTGDFGYVVRFLDYDSIVNSIRENIHRYKQLKVVAINDTLVCNFGTPYKISVLNPKGKVRIELEHAKEGIIGEQKVIPGFEARFPLKSVPDGYLTVKASFETPDGAVVSETRYFKGQLKKHPRVTRVRKDLTVTDAKGRPFFPIGTYGAPVDRYKMLKDAGYNFVVASADDLDEVRKAGLLAAVPVHGKTPEEYYEFIKKYKDHPAVMCWMMYDEPGYNKAGLLFIHDIYMAAYKADKVHPSYLVITTPTVYKTFGQCCDVLAVDTYPITKGQINDVGANIEKAYKDLKASVPVWHCGQMFQWPEQRRPTPQEHRFMSYYALMNGAKGMLWYTFKGYGQDLPVDDPELWNAQKKFLNELHELSPVFLAPGLGESVTTGNENVKAVIKSSPKGTYLFAANTSKTESCNAGIKAGSNFSGMVEVYGENRKVKVDKGIINDKFKPLDVHIYRLK